MGFVESFKGSSIFLKISLALLLVSTFFVWLSFVSAAWGKSDAGSNIYGWGLWRGCSDAALDPGCSNFFGWNLAWYRAVQAFATMGFLSVNICLLFALLLFFHDKCLKGKSISLWTCVLAFWSAFCYFIAVTVFGASFDDDYGVNTELDYGWYLSLFTMLFQIVVGILMILESREVGAKPLDL